MRISRVHISNFRNFRDITIETGQHIILVGANATGKSNFIYALRLILDPTLSRRERHLIEDDFYRGDNLEPWKGRVIKISVDLEDFSEDPQLNCILQNYCIAERKGVARLSYIFRPKANILPAQAGEDNYEAVLFGGDSDKNRLGKEKL